MCGLVGLISENNQEEAFVSMLKVLQYCGPDDHGTLIEQINNVFVHMGQNRLAIRDI